MHIFLYPTFYLFFPPSFPLSRSLFLALSLFLTLSLSLSISFSLSLSLSPSLYKSLSFSLSSSLYQSHFLFLSIYISLSLSISLPLSLSISLSSSLYQSLFLTLSLFLSSSPLNYCMHLHLSTGGWSLLILIVAWLCRVRPNVRFFCLLQQSRGTVLMKSSEVIILSWVSLLISTPLMVSRRLQKKEVIEGEKEGRENRDSV